MPYKDHFSRQAQEYARHRPRYPSALFDYLASLTPEHTLAWDCGTGNGQAAVELARHYERVVATDASADQIARAFEHQRVEYRVEQAEAASFEPASVDLITVAQAVHWFDHDVFYAIVRRVLKPGGVLAVWTYHLPRIAPAVDDLLYEYYAVVLDGYWPAGFEYIHDQYRTLPFPFDEIEPPPFFMTADWSLEHLLGFLESWSATQSYRARTGSDPINAIRARLLQAWGEPAEVRPASWPLTVRVGRLAHADRA